MNVKILHKNSIDSKNLLDRTKGAIKTLKLKAKLVESSDNKMLKKYGVIHTPSLVIDEKVVLQGRVPEMQKIQDILLHESKNSKTARAR
ncbi:MAG TPA: thioredoxin family protein [Ignavibacteriaceae bacterium]|nr:thioredoxin family protein [Ignavibacteriaceae bacterium]